MNNSVNYGWVYFDRWYCCSIIDYHDGFCVVTIGGEVVTGIPYDRVEPVCGCKLPWGNELNNLSPKTCTHIELNAF